MIIENAFFKIPELLTSTFAHRDTYEATVVHFMSTAVLMELNARNVARHFEHVALEKPYPTKSNDDLAIHADLFVNLSGAVDTGGRLALYGSREQNWIEAKALFSSLRSDSTQQKTVNVGRIIRDILRLCLLPEDPQGTIRMNGRYLLLTFSNHPSKSLAYRNRDWIPELLENREAQIEFSLDNEAESLKRAIGSGFINDNELKVKLHCHTFTFEPEDFSQSPVFWGYLVRIKQFKLSVSDSEIEYTDKINMNWTAENKLTLDTIRQEIVKKF